MEHHAFLAVVEQCKSEQGAMRVVAAVKSHLLGDRRLPLPDDVHAANVALGNLVKSVQGWTNAVRMDDAVHAVLHALDTIRPSDEGVERARDLLHAMLLATGERAAAQRREGAPLDSTTQFAMGLDDEATPAST